MTDITMLERKNSPVFYKALVEQFTKIANNPEVYDKEIRYHLLHTLPEIEPLFIMQSEVLAKWVGLAAEGKTKGEFDLDEFRQMPEEVAKSISEMDLVVSLSHNGKDYTVLRSTPLSDVTDIGCFSASLGVNINRFWSDIRTISELDEVPDLDIKKVPDSIAVEIKEINALGDMMNLVTAHLYKDKSFIDYASEVQASFQVYSELPHSEVVRQTSNLIDYATSLASTEETVQPDVAAPDMNALTSLLEAGRQQVINQLIYIIHGDSKPETKIATVTI